MKGVVSLSYKYINMFSINILVGENRLVLYYVKFLVWVIVLWLCRMLIFRGRC